jgi:hypothetical protein
MRHIILSFVACLPLPYFSTLEFSQQIFEKYTNIQFRENPSVGSRIFPCGERARERDGRMEGQTDVKKLISAFDGFSNSPKDAGAEIITSLKFVLVNTLLREKNLLHDPRIFTVHREFSVQVVAVLHSHS